MNDKPQGITEYGSKKIKRMNTKALGFLKDHYANKDDYSVKLKIKKS